MLAIQQITNNNANVYTVPTGKKANVFVDILPTSTTDITVKINTVDYYVNTLADTQISCKLMLSENDVVNVSTTGTVNVFVHGMEV